MKSAARSRPWFCPRSAFGVIGFDNQLIIAEQLRPALTTVALPYEEMGARSVALLVAALAGEEIPPITVIECQRTGRDSV